MARRGGRPYGGSEPATPSPRFLILDGYNVLHAAGLARIQYGPGQLERQRRQLLVLIASRLPPEERARCTVVFDAIEAPPGLPGRFHHEEITVTFAPPGGDADTVIEELIRTHPAPRHLTVISADHRLQTRAKARGAMAQDSDVWLAALAKRPTLRSVGAEPPPPVSPAKSTVENWEQEFGLISIEEIESAVTREGIPAAPKDDWDQHVDRLQNELQNIDDLEKWLKESRERP